MWKILFKVCLIGLAFQPNGRPLGGTAMRPGLRWIRFSTNCVGPDDSLLLRHRFGFEAGGQRTSQRCGFGFCFVDLRGQGLILDFSNLKHQPGVIPKSDHFWPSGMSRGRLACEAEVVLCQARGLTFMRAFENPHSWCHWYNTPGHPSTKTPELKSRLIISPAGSGMRSSQELIPDPPTLPL